MSAQPRSTQQLANKKFLVLGGSSGIGAGVASALIEENATVIISSSSASRVEAAVKKLSDPSIQYNADPKRISGFPVNLQGSEVEKNLEELFSKVGNIDGLIYTAGDSLAIKTLDQQDYSSILATGQLRFIGAILASKVASKYLNPGGSIVLTSGLAGVKPSPNWAVICGFSSAVSGLVRGLALDLSPKNIRVNCVAPGAVRTELWDAFGDEAQIKSLEDLYAKAMLTKHVASPSEIANSYIYLLKDTNTTGETIYSDGGARYSA